MNYKLGARPALVFPGFGQFALECSPNPPSHHHTGWTLVCLPRPRHHAGCWAGFRWEWGAGMHAAAERTPQGQARMTLEWAHPPPWLQGPPPGPLLSPPPSGPFARLCPKLTATSGPLPRGPAQLEGAPCHPLFTDTTSAGRREPRSVASSESPFLAHPSKSAPWTPGTAPPSLPGLLHTVALLLTRLSVHLSANGELFRPIPLTGPQSPLPSPGHRPLSVEHGRCPINTFK